MIDAGLIAPALVITEEDLIAEPADEAAAITRLLRTASTLPNVEIWEVDEAFVRRIIIRTRRPTITTL